MLDVVRTGNAEGNTTISYDINSISKLNVCITYFPYDLYVCIASYVMRTYILRIFLYNHTGSSIRYIIPMEYYIY